MSEVDNKYTEPYNVKNIIIDLAIVLTPIPSKSVFGFKCVKLIRK